MKRWLWALIILWSIVLIYSCKKDSPHDTSSQAQEGLIEYVFEGHFKGQKVVFDTIGYSNAAGNSLSISRLNIILSNITLTDVKGMNVAINEVFYIDPRNILFSIFQLKKIPSAQYTKMTFTLGLIPSENITDKYSFSSEITTMEWPSVMGGGYHFMKLEGNFTVGSSQYGYAIHLGRNGNHIDCSLPLNFQVEAGQVKKKRLIMNVEEWFKNPYVYDLDKDGNYTMSDSALMAKIRINGKDVFQIE